MRHLFESSPRERNEAPTFVVAKLDPGEVRTALEPLEAALQTANHGILELTRIRYAVCSALPARRRFQRRN